MIVEIQNELSQVVSTCVRWSHLDEPRREGRQAIGFHMFVQGLTEKERNTMGKTVKNWFKNKFSRPQVAIKPSKKIQKVWANMGFIQNFCSKTFCHEISAGNSPGPRTTVASKHPRWRWFTGSFPATDPNKWIPSRWNGNLGLYPLTGTGFIFGIPSWKSHPVQNHTAKSQWWSIWNQTPVLFKFAELSHNRLTTEPKHPSLVPVLSYLAKLPFSARIQFWGFISTTGSYYLLPIPSHPHHSSDDPRAANPVCESRLWDLGRFAGPSSEV